MDRETRSVAAIVAVGLAVAGIAAYVSRDQGADFNCARDEVGIWVDYDDQEMTCVPATDHQAHQGDHDG